MNWYTSARRIFIQSLKKYILTLVISGDADGERWTDFEHQTSTTVDGVYDFILRIL